MLDGRTAPEIGINSGKSLRAFSGCRRASGSGAEARFLSQAKGSGSRIVCKLVHRLFLRRFRTKARSAQPSPEGFGATDFGSALRTFNVEKSNNDKGFSR